MEQQFIVKQKISIWQILFYFSMGVVLLWLILKLSGVIQTPVWLEFGVPIAGLFVGIFTMYHNLMRAITKVGITVATLIVKVDHLEKDVSSLKQDMHLVKQDMTLVKQDMNMVKHDVSIVKKKLHLH